MPWSVKKSTSLCSTSKPWAVVNDNTGKVVPGGCHKTKAEALDHQKALYANVTDATQAVRAAVPISENLVTIPGITLAETGTWQASTGEVTFTESDLRAAVAALDDPAIKAPRMRFGHTDPFTPLTASAGDFASQPCVGKFINLRMSDDGQSIVADLAGVPKWLAEILPVAYPNRSIEGYWNVKSATGKEHDFVIASVAVLGADDLPAVATLEDLQILFSADGPDGWTYSGERVAASRAPQERSVRASVPYEDVRRAFYEEVATEDTGRYWWWIHQVYIDPQMVIADDDAGGWWAVPYTVSGDQVNFSDPEEVRIQWVQKDNGKVLASAAALLGRPVVDYSKAADSRPSNRSQEGQKMSIDIGALRTRLGLTTEQLPDDASEEQINEAIASTPAPQNQNPEEGVPAIGEPSAGTAGQPAEGTPQGEGGTTEGGSSVTASGVMVDAETWAQVQRDAEAGRRAREEQVNAQRRATVDAAVKARKIPPSRRDHYISLMERDEKGTREFLDNLAENAVPGPEIGTSADGEELQTRAQGTGLLPELKREEA